MTLPHERQTTPPAKSKAVDEVRAATQSFASLSLRSLQDVDRFWAEQTAFARSLFDAWLCGARQVADTGRGLYSAARAAEWCQTATPDEAQPSARREPRGSA